MPYAAFHFHRYAPDGVIANLLAMPIVSLWVMPAGILAVLALPFGLDAELWKLMGLGIDWMILVALWVAKLPGALGRVQAFGIGPLIARTLGMVLICSAALAIAVDRCGGDCVGNIAAAAHAAAGCADRRGRTRRRGAGQRRQTHHHARRPRYVRRP